MYEEKASNNGVDAQRVKRVLKPRVKGKYISMVFGDLYCQA
jgi:hypothetical protein